MPHLDRIPKDAIWLTANDKEDFMRLQQNWVMQGWALASDYVDGLFSVIALKDSRVLICVFKEPGNESEPSPADTSQAVASEPDSPISEGQPDDIDLEETAATEEALRNMGH